MAGTSKSHSSHRKKKRSFFDKLLRSFGIRKRRHQCKPSSKSSIERDLGLQSVDASDEIKSNEIAEPKSSTKSNSKYRKAITRHKKREKRKGLSTKWTRWWQDALYFLNLRNHPYDPFSKKPEHRHTSRKMLTMRQSVVYLFNSTVLFLITYIIAYLTYQLTVIFVASFYGIDSVLYYYEVFFPIGNNSDLWTPFNIIVITLSGPIISLIFGLVYYKLFLPQDAIGPVSRLFFLWLSFHSFNMFFGAYVAGVITDQGFGYVVNWMYMRVLVKFTIAMLALFVLMVIGYFATKPLLETSNSVQRINRENRSYFILTQAVVPWIIGSIILLLIKIPNKDPQHENIIIYDVIIIATLAFAIIPTFFNKKAKPDSFRFKSKKRMKFVWVYMLIAILLIIAYRLGLSDGLHFLIRIMFRVEPYG